MATAKYFKASGEAGKARELPIDLFDGIVNEAVLHQAVKAYLANQRQGTASTKTRGEVKGGSKKIWRQKGTGRARQGSIRAPHWRGGGIVFGPSPRDYTQDLPKKVRALARRSAFNTRANNEQVSIIEKFDLDAPKTRRIVDLLEKIGFTDRKVLILTSGNNPVLFKSVRNLQNVAVVPFREVSAYEVLNAHELLIEEAAFDGVSEAEATDDAAAKKSKPAKEPKAAKAKEAKPAREPKAKKAAAVEETDATVEAVAVAEVAEPASEVTAEPTEGTKRTPSRKKKEEAEDA